MPDDKPKNEPKYLATIRVVELVVIGVIIGFFLGRVSALFPN